VTILEQKKAAAEEALKFVEDGMLLGLGTGSTADLFTEALGKKVAEGLNVKCVPTSEATRQLAERLDIEIVQLNDHPVLDLTVDGADELDANLRLIKGGGGALLREKIVATSSKMMIVIADESKKVETLGKFPLPVEVVQYGARATAFMVGTVGEWAGCTGKIELRKDDIGNPFITDNGNYIIDCHFGEIADPEKLLSGLAAIAGVVEHGLFIGIAKKAILGTPFGPVTLEAGG
jgi:ribose 5-phosphate isomerase A